MKTAELTGLALCYAICTIEMPHLVWGKTIGVHEHSDQITVPELGSPKCFSPFMGWDMFGPIIERENISIIRCNDDYDIDHRGKSVSIPVWAADSGKNNAEESTQHEQHDAMFQIYVSSVVHGSTPLIAALRCHAVSKFGVSIKLPPELAARLNQPAPAGQPKKLKPSALPRTTH